MLMARALHERPTQLRRFPEGVTGEMIYQKRVPKYHPDWVETARVTFPSGRHADERCVTELGQVIVLAYLDAYTKLVTQLGGLPTNAAAAAPVAN